MGSRSGRQEYEQRGNVVDVHVFLWLFVIHGGHSLLGSVDHWLEVIWIHRNGELCEDLKAEFEEILIGDEARIILVEVGPDWLDGILEHSYFYLFLLLGVLFSSLLGLCAQLVDHSWSPLIHALLEEFFVLWVPELPGLGNRVFVDEFVPEAGEPAAEEGSSDVDTQTHPARRLSIRIFLAVRYALENSLEQSDRWVDASTGHATRHANG